jgi:hypothetical protein
VIQCNLISIISQWVNYFMRSTRLNVYLKSIVIASYVLAQAMTKIRNLLLCDITKKDQTILILVLL